MICKVLNNMGTYYNEYTGKCEECGVPNSKTCGFVSNIRIIKFVNYCFKLFRICKVKCIL